MCQKNKDGSIDFAGVKRVYRNKNHFIMCTIFVRHVRI